MIRLLGAITGSALAVGALLLLIGIPQFRAEPAGSVDRPVVTLPRATRAVETAETPAASVVPDAISDTIADANFDLDNEIDMLPDLIREPSQALPVEAEPEWYAFWSPFRSELAASGFVDQLQRVTGLDYRVVKVKTGVYEVAFAYRSDTDIGSHLSQITAATGLEMSDR